MTKSFSDQLPINLITNIIVFLLSVGINIFMTPFYIDKIGIEGLGLIRLALTIPMYTSLATIFITGSVSRYLIIALQQKDTQKANSILSTSLITLSLLILALLPVMAIIVLNIELFFNFPEQFHEEMSILFIAVLATSLISLLSSIFTIPARAYNRLDITNSIQIFTTIIQTSLIVLLLSYFPKMISMVGIAFFIGSILSLLFAIKVWKTLTPELEIKYSFFKKSVFSDISTMGSWLIVSHLGTLLFLYTDLWVINIFFGATGTGEYSIGLQWSTLLRSMAAVFASVLTPIILISYAQKNFSKLVMLSSMGVKFMGLVLALPIGVIAGFASPLLTLWLGESYAILAPLLWLMLLPLVINLAVTPLFSLNTAYNKVKVPGIVTLIMGAFNLALAIGISKYFDFGIYGVALAGAIVLTLKNTFFIPIYSAKTMDINAFTYFKELLVGALFVLLTFYSSWYVVKTFTISSWLVLLSFMIVVFFGMSVLVWIVGLNSTDRNFLIKTFLKRKSTEKINHA